MAKSQSNSLVASSIMRATRHRLRAEDSTSRSATPAAEKHRLLRVIDESGEDYLYPKVFFRAIALPQAVRKAIIAAA